MLTLSVLSLCGEFRCRCSSLYVWVCTPCWALQTHQAQLCEGRSRRWRWLHVWWMFLGWRHKSHRYILFVTQNMYLYAPVWIKCRVWPLHICPLDSVKKKEWTWWWLRILIYIILWSNSCCFIKATLPRRMKVCVGSWWHTGPILPALGEYALSKT